MAVPRNRHSNARKNTKRSHHALKSRGVSTCAACGAAKMPHRACSSCGSYRGRVVVAREEAESEE